MNRRVIGIGLGCLVCVAAVGTNAAPDSDIERSGSITGQVVFAAALRSKAACPSTKTKQSAEQALLTRVFLSILTAGSRMSLSSLTALTPAKAARSRPRNWTTKTAPLSPASKP